MGVTDRQSPRNEPSNARGRALARALLFSQATTDSQTLASAIGPAHAQSAAPVANGTPACQIGPHDGLPDADARTSADIVCEEIRTQGQPIGRSSAPA